MIAAALSSDARAALSSSAWFGYRPFTLPTVATTSRTIAATHTTMRTRSRRNANRVSGAVAVNEASVAGHGPSSRRRSASSVSCASSSP